MEVKPLFVKETIKMGQWNREILEERYSQSVLLFPDVKTGSNLGNYFFSLQYKGISKRYKGFSYCQSFNAVFLETIDEAIGRVIRPIDLYIVNSAENRLDKIVDINSYEVKALEQHIQEQARSKRCNIYELVFDSLTQE